MWHLGLACALLLTGCDTLFPEFASKPDAAAADGGADGAVPGPQISGGLCTLRDLRDYRTCVSALAPSFRITVEETRDQTLSDANGHFTLPLSESIPVATVAVIDPTSGFVPTISPLHLTAGQGMVQIPIIPVETANLMAAQIGDPLDPTRGTLLVYAVDDTLAPVAGVSTSANSAAIGPLYDGPQASQLENASATSARGLIAFFDVPVGTAKLHLQPAATASVAADDFELPVRAGATTVSLAVLPPR
jgi:hypothetical protein